MESDIRQLDLEGIRTAVDWTRREGWNPGLRDADVFAAADGQGYWGLYRDGKLAATISVVHYSDAFAFLGFYICRPEDRGKGLGLELWNHALSRATARSIGLDGVKAQQANYAKSGFVLAHGNLRYGGPKPSRSFSIPAAARRLGPQHAEDIVRFEAAMKVFPTPRPRFLRAWLEHEALGLYDDDRLMAFGVLRPCHDGAKIGPLFATTPQQAEAVVHGLLANAPAGNIFLDVPAINREAVDLARSLNLEPMFETARMYRGPAPDLDISKVFGITTFELG